MSLCKSCRWYRPHDNWPGRGECMYSPPSVSSSSVYVPVSDSFLRLYRPFVKETDYCSRYEETRNANSVANLCVAG